MNKEEGAHNAFLLSPDASRSGPFFKNACDLEVIEVKGGAQELGDHSASFDDHGGCMVRLGPVTRNDPVLAAKAIPCDDVPGRAGAEDSKEVLQHVTTATRSAYPLGG